MWSERDLKDWGGGARINKTAYCEHWKTGKNDKKKKAHPLIYGTDYGVPENHMLQLAILMGLKNKVSL